MIKEINRDPDMPPNIKRERERAQYAIEDQRPAELRSNPTRNTPTTSYQEHMLGDQMIKKKR